MKWQPLKVSFKSQKLFLLTDIYYQDYKMNKLQTFMGQAKNNRHFRG